MSEKNLDTTLSFTKVMTVGWSDRGMGRGNFGILSGEGHLLAKVESTHFPPDDPRNFVVLPERENAFLFAGAPMLHEACTKAVEWIRDEKRALGREELVALLEAALAGAAPPKQ